jgi:hypothetical protein
VTHGIKSPSTSQALKQTNATKTKVGITVHKGEEVAICLSKYFTSKTNDQISIAFGGVYK